MLQYIYTSASDKFKELPIMTNTVDKRTEQENKEEKINAIELLQEIEPLLKEYFIADVHMEGSALQMKFSNGQTFRITACGADL